MGIVQAVKQVASDVAGTAKDAVAKSATQVAQTPLELLESLLGQSPTPDSGKSAGATAPEEAGSASQVNPEELKQKELADEQYKAMRTTELHREIQERSQAYYDQKKASDLQKAQAEAQAKEQQKYQIMDKLERKKADDFALNAAKDASSAEKRVGAG